jgi:hypothetical protein
MFNTTATAKIIYNAKLNTYRLLVAFNTKHVTVQNAVYKSGDLTVFVDSSATSINHALQSAMRDLRISAIQHLQFTNPALANLCAININSIYMQE